MFVLKTMVETTQAFVIVAAVGADATAAMAVDDVFVNLMISFDRFLLLPLLIPYKLIHSLFHSHTQSPTHTHTQTVHIILYACHFHTDSLYSNV